MSRLNCITLSSFQQKSYEVFKETGKYSSFTGEKKKMTESIPEEAQTLGILDRDFNWLKYAQVAEENHGRRN